jgi:hypothetical protein
MGQVGVRRARTASDNVVPALHNSRQLARLIVVCFGLRWRATARVGLRCCLAPSHFWVVWGTENHIRLGRGTDAIVGVHLVIYLFLLFLLLLLLLLLLLVVVNADGVAVL